MEILLLICITLTFSPAAVHCDSISPRQPKVSGDEEGSVSLQCSFSTSSAGYDLLWYRQYPHTPLQFISLKGGGTWSGDRTADFAKDRFSSAVAGSSTTLTISKLSLSDSAVYFCALKAGTRRDYADKLIFGKGTTLTVRPKRSDTVKGTLNVLQPFDDKGPTACLASMYFDNDGDMTLTDNNDKVSSHSKDLALLSKKDRLYYLAGVSDNGIKNCTHKGRASQKKQDSEKATTATPTVETEECQSRNDTAKKDTKDFAKLNFMSLTVNGLRMLFAKTVTFNMLMTVRAMII